MTDDLDAIDGNTALGKRDYTLIMLLLRMGLHRSEAALVTLGDLTMEQGYSIAIVRHGKGNKPGSAKLPVEVRQAVDGYLEVVGWMQAGSEAPFFVSFRKGDHLQEKPVTGNHIERMVKT